MVPAYEGKEAYIFVSYAHKDSAAVLPIIEKLYEQKYRIWYDEGIAPGSEWPKNIADHLNGASAVLIFVSQNSLDSENCENEVSRASKSDKLLIEYKLAKEEHKLLKQKITDGSCKAVCSEAELIDSIPEQYIGDGSGYERKIVRNRYGAFWNAMLALAGLLIIAVCVGLYGLNQGWFDDYLPGVNTETSVRKESQIIREQPEAAAQLDNGLIEAAVLMQSEKTQLSKKLTFENEEDKANIIHNLGFEQLEHEPTYMDLTGVQNDSVCFEYVTDTTLMYLTYLPNLRELEIHRGDIDSLEILRECPKLETVRLRKEVFPVDIPENVRFRVVLQN